MKKFTLFLFFIIVWCNTKSQTFTYSSFSMGMNSNTSIALADQNSFNTGLLSIVGSGVTWDASAIVQQAGTPIVQFGWYNPSTTPNGNLFPSSNFVYYDPLLTSVLEYQYYGVNSDSLVNWGVYGPNGAHEIYSNPDKSLVFPFSLNQVMTDTYAKTNYSDATTVSSFQTGSRTVTFSGFGTLILPQGTFSNIALVSELRTNSLGPNSTTFTWFDINSGKQLLYYAENNGNVNVAFSLINPSSGTIENKEISSLQLSPNPSNGIISIRGLENIKIISGAVFSYSGKLMCENNLEMLQSGKLNVSDLAPGIYFLKINSAQNTFVSKVIIE